MSIESSHDSQPAQNSGAATDVSRQNVQPFAAQALARSRLISDIAKVSLKKDVSDNRQRRWSLNDWAVALGTLRVQNSQWLHIDSCCGLGYSQTQTLDSDRPGARSCKLWFSARITSHSLAHTDLYVGQPDVCGSMICSQKDSVKCPETVCVFSIIFMYF